MRTPFASISGPSGVNLFDRYGKDLTAMRIYDEAGGESDRLEFDLVVDLPFPAGPAKGTKYSAYIGWSEEGARLGGIYTVQSHSFSGDNDSGYIMTVAARASDFLDEMKKVDSEDFTDKTVGDIVNSIAKKANASAVIAPELSKIKIPYRLRWNQSSADFLTELASEIGATMKPAGGKILMLERGKGKTAGGGTLPTINISANDVIDVDFDIESRGEFKDVEGSHFDQAKGIVERVKEAGKGEFSRFIPVHPFPSKDEAKRAVKAHANEEARRTISGSFTIEGNEAATAEAKVKPSGFGPDIDGADLVASSVTHEVVFDDQTGWLTNISVENGDG